MPDQWFLSLAMDLRARAAEIAARAETFHDEEARQKMLSITEAYLKLAQRLEQRADTA
jgi:hypothetical protein